MKCLKLRHEIDTTSVTVTKHGKITRDSYKLAKGWYMLEAHPADTGLGCTLDIRTYSEKQCQHICGIQKIQLTNARASKRIIQIKHKSKSISISSNTRGSQLGAKRIILIRISLGYAKHRMKSALRHMESNDTDLHRFSTDTNTLYANYSQLCPTPSVNTVYKRFSKAASNPLQLVLEESCFCQNFAIVYADKLHEAKQRSDYAPYIILTTSKVQATEQFIDTLTAIIENREVSACLWYTDHDHFTNDGSRVQAILKPGKNKGLLQHGNYVGPLLICSRQLYNSLGGVDSTLDDSAILLFLLRAFDALEEPAIKRIAHISYSLPVSHYQAPHGLYCGKYDSLALEKYLSMSGNSGYCLDTGIFPQTWMLKPQRVEPEPCVNIIIATRDRVDLLEQCIDSILSNTCYTNYKITVVDNDSVETRTHAYHQRMSESSRYQKIDYSGDFNFSAINNLAAAQSDADILVLLNNDTQVLEPYWLEKIAAQLSDEEIACVGVRLIYPNGLLQHAGIVTGLLGVAGHLHQFATREEDGYCARIRHSFDVSAVTAACLGVRRSVYIELEGLDEVNLKVAYNDVDFCLRARNAGYRNRYLANVTLIHHESVSRGSDNTPQKKARFKSEYEYMKNTHQKWIQDDPAWHPRFSKVHTTPLLTGT